MRTLSGLSVAVLGVALIGAPQADAAVFTLDFDGTSVSSNAPHTGAAASVDFDFADEGGDVRVTLGISNTTGNVIFGDGATASKLTGFGFDLLSGTSFITGSFVGDSFFDTVILNASANPFDDLDFAVADNSNFNGGNANDALPQGQTSSVNFLLDSLSNAADLGAAFQAAFFDVNNPLQANTRFQQVEGGNNNGASDKLQFVPPAQVPVPAALPLFLTALAGLGFVATRRRRRLA